MAKEDDSLAENNEVLNCELRKGDFPKLTPNSRGDLN